MPRVTLGSGRAMSYSGHFYSFYAKRFSLLFYSPKPDSSGAKESLTCETNALPGKRTERCLVAPWWIGASAPNLLGLRLRFRRIAVVNRVTHASNVRNVRPTVGALAKQSLCEASTCTVEIGILLSYAIGNRALYVFFCDG